MKFVKLALATGAALAGISVAASAEAAVVINFLQVGANVQIVATGTFDRSLASAEVVNVRMSKVILPNQAFFGFGANSNIDQYASVGAPTTFGSGGFFTSTQSSTGTAIGMNGSASAFFIDTAYVSNSAINASALIYDKTFATIGLNAATYSFLVARNQITVNIGAPVAAVPETATWAMMIAGFGLIGSGLRTRRRSTTLTFA